MQTTRPWIGITCGTSVQDPSARNPQDRLNQAYSRAVERAGGLPVILPPSIGPDTYLNLLDRLDGLLVSGGYDCAPNLFGEDILNESVELDLKRDDTELPLILAARERDMPVLCICRGIQALNVAMGGTLYQDLPDQKPTDINHRQPEARHVATHEVAVEPGSKLADIVGMERFGVNSFHHQALKDVAPGLTVTARADDGTIEAVEDPTRRFLVAVQYHPEEMVAVSEPSSRLFGAFVEACRTENTKL